MVFSYCPPRKKLLGFGFGECTAKNSLLSNIMHPYVLRGLMAKACKKLKYNGNFFVGWRQKSYSNRFIMRFGGAKSVDFMQLSSGETFPLSPVRMFFVPTPQPTVGWWMFMMVCNKSLLNSCPSGRKRKALNARLYFTGGVLLN